MFDQNSVVAVYNRHRDAEDAVKELQRGGFDMKKLSIVGKEYHTEQNIFTVLGLAFAIPGL